MAQTTTSQPQARTSYMFPWLHKKVVKELGDSVPSVWYCRKPKERQTENEYTTHTMGTFRCTNGACAKPGWDSKMVAISIRGYAGYGYNAVVYNQRCEMCNELGTLTLNIRSYVERVAYRIKKWAGVQTDRPQYAAKEGLPHKADLCEGCKRGLCGQMSKRD